MATDTDEIVVERAPLLQIITFRKWEPKSYQSGSSITQDGVVDCWVDGQVWWECRVLWRRGVQDGEIIQVVQAVGQAAKS